MWTKCGKPLKYWERPAWLAKRGANNHMGNNYQGPGAFRASQHNRNFAGAHRDADINGYELLANAIVLQAVVDYRNALNSGDRRSQYALELFFNGEWCNALTKLDMAVVAKKIRSEYK